MALVLRADDGRLSWQGAVSLERTEEGVMAWRIPHEERVLFAEALQDRAAMAAGVRISFLSDTRSVAGRFVPAEGLCPIDLCCDGEVVCSQALMALADTAMVIACSAAWNGYRPMSTIDQTTHFLRPVNFDVIADARVVRIGRNTSFGRVMMLNAADKRPVGMVASAYSMQ